MNSRDLADSICRALRGAGHQAYLVGGCVRDLLLGQKPTDYDVATDARPEKVQQIFPRSLGVGAQFGVVLVIDPTAQGDDPRSQVEVATFRSDIGYSDGRHPDRVEYARSPEEDVRRRDFTINGLMMDPRTGEILDFVGGRQDLRDRVVRAIGDPAVRFREDKLRMLRAVRFAARLNYDVDASTFSAIQKGADQVREVSAERLRDELTKLLTEGAARRGFELLDESNLLGVLLPEVARMKGVEQPPQFHPEGDVWIHTRMMLEHLQPHASTSLAWAVLLHDVGKPPTFAPAERTGDRIRFNGHAEIGARMAVEICSRFRFSTADTEQVETLVANHLRFKDVFGMRPATLKRFVQLPRFEEHLELHRLDCLCSHGQMNAYEFVKRFIRDTPPAEIHPPRLINGETLKQMGYRPGPLFKDILSAVEEAQLDGRLDSREEAMKFVRGNFSQHSVQD